MPRKNILITGATGLQGRTLLTALAPKPDTEPAVHVLALTRSPTSRAAKSLAAEKHVTVVQGDMDSVEHIRKIFEDAKESGGIWGVFCVVAFPGLGAKADGEERQGKMMADLSLEYGVSVYIYSSSERRGDKFDDKEVLSNAAKVAIERHIRFKLSEKGLPWVILRPGFFMENYNGKVGSITVGVLKAGLKPTTTLALIAADDIGRVAAGVFENPEPYIRRILVPVGDLLTMSEQEAAYKEATGGKTMPSIPDALAQFTITINRHTKGLLKNIELHHEARISGEHPEYDAQVALATKASQMRSFKTWAEQRNDTGNTRDQNWNQVSIWGLLTGKQ